MKTTLKGLAFAAIIALSLLASTGDAFAKDQGGRGTAWTYAPPLPEPLGVTWKEFLPLLRDGITWEE